MTSQDVSAILSLRGIQKNFGSTAALRGVNLDVYAGEVVALLGENGAGKSTLSNVIFGTVLPDAGEMTWQGRRYSPANPREAIDSGIAMIHQELLLLPYLSIAENMFVGRYPMKHGRVDRVLMEERASRGLQRLGLDISPGRLVDGLSTANQQLIEIAKALTLNARLLVLDEPTASLGSKETVLLFKQIERLKVEGVGIIYISHRLEEIRQIADRVVVMRDGEKIEEFGSGDIPVRTIVKAMVGRSLEQMFPEIPEPEDEILLQVQDYSAIDGTFKNVSFEVKTGEIFGIAGLVGASRTELVRTLTGADPRLSGTLRLRGKEITPKAPMDAIRNGMVLVPEDRKLQGVVLEQSIEENIAYANRQSVTRSGWVIKRWIRQFANDCIQRFGIKGRGSQNVDEMSGGNQQKVVLAKWLARDPKVVILDEPTRGIDVGARSTIYEVIVGLANSGIAVIVVSSDLEEVLGLSNRIMVMAGGRNRGILKRSDANDVSVMELATQFH